MYLNALVKRKEALSVVATYDSLKDALKKMKDSEIEYIPVVNDNHFYGVITKNQIYEAFFKQNDKLEDFITKTKVETLYNKKVYCIKENDDLDKIVNIFKKSSIPFIGVTENDEFIGIINSASIYSEMSSILGTDKGYKMSITFCDIKGQIAKLAKIISKHGGNIINLAMRNPDVPTKIKEVIVKIQANDIEKIENALNKDGFQVNKF